jgi:LmbE family N-acetylglucosaminyl deacetylase
MADGGLLVALAHPDDESLISGTIARYASGGMPVTMLCATRGEVGEIAPDTGATRETLGAVREQELRDACRLLGVEDVRFLDHRDSGMEGTPENQDPRSFANADAERVVGEILAVIQDVRPKVVVTWDETGGYGHPDHMAMHGHVLAAFERTQDKAPSDAPAALFYMAIPIAEFVRVMTEMRARGIEIGQTPGNGEAAESMPRAEANCVLDVSDEYELKRQALRAHKTQLDTFGPFTNMPPDLERSFFGREYFYRARPRLPDGQQINDLFADLP